MACCDYQYCFKVLVHGMMKTVEGGAAGRAGLLHRVEYPVVSPSLVALATTIVYLNVYILPLEFGAASAQLAYSPT